MGRFYPRNLQSRRDSQLGVDHVSNVGPRSPRSARDADAIGIYTLPGMAVAATQGNSVAASSVVAGFAGIKFTISGGADRWARNLLSTTAKVNSLIAGLSGSGFAGIAAAMDATVFSVDLTGMILNVAMPAVAAYSIGATQTYAWTFLEGAFENRAGSVAVTSVMVVKNGV